MIAAADPLMLQSFVSNLPAPVLADLVIANMAHLPLHPPHHLTMPSHPSLPAPAAPLAGGPALVQPHQPPLRTATPPLPLQHLQQQQQRPSGQRSQTPPVATGYDRPLPPPPALKQPQQLGPKPLVPVQQQPLPQASRSHQAPSLPRVTTLNVQRHLPAGRAALPADMRPTPGHPTPAAPTSTAAASRAAATSAFASRTPLLLSPLPMPAEQRIAMRDAAVGRMLAIQHLPQVEVSTLLLIQLRPI